MVGWSVVQLLVIGFLARLSARLPALGLVILSLGLLGLRTAQ
jgi:hypothetical protein